MAGASPSLSTTTPVQAIHHPETGQPMVVLRVQGSWKQNRAPSGALLFLSRRF